MKFEPSDLYYYMLDMFVNKYLQTDRTQKICFFNEGGARCFNGDQKVITISGPKRIKDIIHGDKVLTLNEDTMEKEYKPVQEVHKFENTKRTIRVKMKDGATIECTDDHEFYHEGGWHSLKHLLSLIEKA